MEAKHDGINPTRLSLERAHTFLPIHEAGGLRSQPFLAALRSLARRELLCEISGDLRERADILKGQIDGTEARFQVVITELQKERATQRQRLETELQAIHH
jgi:hypothetical protein